MLNQGTYNQGNEYESVKKAGVCIGFLCGGPVYRRFDARDIKPYNCYLSNFAEIARSVVAGPQPANQMGSLRL